MADPVGAKRLTRAQKRALGILAYQVFANAIRMFKDGDLNKDMTATEMAFVYAAEVMDSQEFGDAWSEVSGPDWDAILAFIEKMMELLIKFLPLILPLFV